MTMADGPGVPPRGQKLIFLTGHLRANLPTVLAGPEFSPVPGHGFGSSRFVPSPSCVY